MRKTEVIRRHKLLRREKLIRRQKSKRISRKSRKSMVQIDVSKTTGPKRRVQKDGLK